MFNRKLKLRVKELESQMSGHFRSICSLRKTERQNGVDIGEIYFRTKHIKAPVKPSETEDSKTFEYPYKYTFSDAKKEKEIPVDVRDKILNDYGKSLERDLLFNDNDALPDAQKEKATNIFLDQEKQVLMRFGYWKSKNSPNSFVITTDLIEEYLKRNLK